MVNTARKDSSSCGGLQRILLGESRADNLRLPSQPELEVKKQPRP
jgi:hypothetical protein